MTTFFKGLLYVFVVLFLSACTGGGSPALIDKLFGGGQTPILTSIQDQTVAQTDTLIVDVNNILDGSPGSDEDMSYQCYFDSEVDNIVLDSQLCADIPNSSVQFNAATGELLWTPQTGILGNYEVKIRGTGKGGTYDEIFSVGVRLKFGGIGLYTSISGTSVTMTWTPNTSAVAYQVFKLNSLTGQYELFKTVNDPNASGTVLTGLLPNTGYTFRAQALDPLGFLDGNVVSRSVTTTELVRLAVTSPSATATAGVPVAINVKAYNADGSEQTVGGLPIILSITSGTSLGSFSAVTDNNDGTYTAQFTPTFVGTDVTIEASINISYFLMSSVQLTINPGPAVSANSSIAVASPSVVSGSSVLVTATLRDAFNNNITSATVNFLKSGGSSTGTFSAVTNAGSGVYTTQYSGIAAGTAQTLRVEVNGVILTPQTTITVVPGLASSSTSTISTTAASIASGTNATITATLRDANSNLISSGVFVAFNKSGGTATGNLSAVTNLGNGQYSASYTGLAAGTAQTITVIVDGVALSPSTSVAVVPAAPSLANSTLDITSNTVASSQFVTVVATLKDLNNNPVTSGYTVDFTKTGGTSTGTFSALSNQGGGVYNIRYTGVLSGTAQTIAVTINSVALGLTQSITVTPGTPSPTLSTITRGLASVTAGANTTITATLRDSNNNLIPSGYTVSLSKFGGTANGQLSAVTNVGNGTYTATYTGETAGSAQTVQMVVDGLPLGPSTTIAVTAGAPDNTLSTFTVSASTVTAGASVSLEAQLKDAYGNPISSGYVVGFQTLGGSSTGNFSAVTNSGGGLYTASFQGITVGSALVIQTTVNAAGIGPNRSVQVQVGAPHATYSSISATPSPVSSGSFSQIEAVVKDAYNNPINTEYTITFDATLGTSSGTFSNQTNPSSGVHRIRYNAELAGSAQTLRVLANGAPIAGVTTPLQVTAGTLDIAQSTFSISATTLQSGTQGTLSMSFRDSFGNSINSATVTFSKSAGVSDGTLSSPATFNGSGNYTATYTASTQGAAQTIYPIVNGTHFPGLSVNVTVLAGPPSQFSFSGTTTNLNAIDCHGPFTITLKDSQNNTTSSATGVTIGLVAQNSGAFDGRLFSDNLCSQTTTDVTFAVGVSSGSFYLKSYLPMTEVLNLDAPAGIADQSKTFSILPVNAILGSSAVSTTTGTSAQFIGSDAATGFVEPYGAHTYGDYIYIADQSANRVLRFNHVTQSFAGWIGHIGDDTGISAGCSGLNVNDLSPTWCTGGRSQTQGTPTILRGPRGLAADGTYLYVTTVSHQVLRFNLSTGAYMGWIGRIGGTAATSPQACIDAGLNTPTPTWCYGGVVNNSTADGSFSSPSEIVIQSGKLYIADSGNHRIQKWDVAGTYDGWVGRIATAATSPQACIDAGTNVPTPTWCKGGTPGASNRRNLPAFNQVGAATPIEGLSTPRGLANDNTYLYVGDTGNRRIVRISIAGGAFSGWMGRLHQGTGNAGFYPNSLNLTSTSGNTYPTTWIEGGGTFESSSNTGFGEIYSLWQSGGVLYAADATYHKLIKIDAADGQNYEWVGRISTSPSGGSPGCSATPNLSVTPGWCRGGAGNVRGNGNLSFNSIYGVTGNSTHIYALDRGNYRVQKINKSTGLFENWLGTQISSSNNWRRSFTGSPSGVGYDNYSFADIVPGSGWNGIALKDQNLFVTDSGWHRIKKHQKEDGTMIGYIGILDGNVSSGAAVGGFPPSGPEACFGVTTGMTPNWCLGGGRTTSGSGVHGYSSPRGVAAAGNYIYIANNGNHRIDRVAADDALYSGWQGLINTSPTDGDGTCNGAAADTVTPGWCIGGAAKAGGGIGSYDGPRSIFYDSAQNKLYVTDNRKVARLNAVTGEMEAMLGHISTAGTGCTISGQGGSAWCGAGAVAGTGSSYYGALNDPTGVATNSNYVFVTDTATHRIHRFNKSTGAPAGFLAKMSNNTRINVSNSDACQGLSAGYPRVTPGWCVALVTGAITTQAGSEENAFNSPRGIWADDTYIYVADTLNNRILRINAESGLPAGWKGEIGSTVGMTDTDCINAGVNAITPKWCDGGASRPSMKVGGFNNPSAIIGDQFYLYIQDARNNRIAIIPRN